MILNKKIKGAVNWLCEAQDINNSGGVSKFFHIEDGWCKEDYQEVSGYIIETFLELYIKTKEKKYLDRAKRIGDWELLVQGKSGKWEYIFDTGQIILGLTELYIITKHKKYLDSIIKASDWLVNMQSTDGHWRKEIFACGVKNRSLRATGLLKHSYNTRTAWSLLKVWKITNNDKYKKAAIKNIDAVIKLQRPNGFYINATNLTHFLTYTARGILESGVILRENKYINSVVKYTDSCINKIDDSGFLSVEFDSNWNTLAPKCSCLTANCQLSIILIKLSKITGHLEYKKFANKLITYVSKTQELNTSNKGIYGGIAGSSPIMGCYEKGKMLPWATKFYIDALLLIQNE